MNWVNLPPIPTGFLEKMQRLLGDEFQAFAHCYTQPAQIGLRINSLKCSPDEIIPAILQDATGWLAFHLEPVPWCPTGFLLKPERDGGDSPVQPGKHPYHLAGLYYLQDPSAMAVAEVLHPQPGEWVLDLAAAPGGKTTHLAALMQNQGTLIANEIHPQRVWDLAQNIERCGVTNTIILNETPQRLADRLGPLFDRVLVDAPCSGEGMFRKSAEARQAWSPELVASCASRQIKILKSAASLVRPGGYLCYSTCTFSPEENEQVIARFLDDQNLAGNPFDLVQIAKPSGFKPGEARWASPDFRYPLERSVRLWPHHGAAEGHFIALMQRKGAPAHPSVKGKLQKLPADGWTLFNEFVSRNLAVDFPHPRVAFHNGSIYLTPDEIPPLAGLKVIRLGWQLGSLRKKRFEPSHALAMGLRTDQAQQVLAFSVADPHLSAYLSGEHLPIPGEEGWVLIAIHPLQTNTAFPIGWGKRSQNIIKNHYPRGLRWRR